MVSQEWQSEGQHDVDHDTEGPDICFLSVRMIQDDLWGAIGQGAEGMTTLFMR
jgi:hypothetical protein